ncbi:hypothetical protein GUITHDRAFT_113626 [Guillardia theta CCMP2712]|uniref:PX domain-containing protein n=1 Tax=Guillardia theta (strain CCMP2712) TaxID=905079 RepID=L1IVY0_GUITC|nr:hypothetical protein GUITHDRAFT_113626 [Guillardia theta CCMP2712]EKX40386.1 hypothetical protein GUITHDRAFT_113626 [Guillardia theta CCMP2712]|eukprot:XP_005827366.1 hypothetical protein GUITHDRAFT_113626 [Guillardia theta CCMP2712]
MGFSAFLVNFIDTEVRSDRGCGGLNAKYVVYVLKIVNGDRQWLCEKRYSDFVLLDDVLRSKFWYMQVPKLPQKKFFFNFDEEFISRRRKELEEYLRSLLQSEEMWQFLTDQKSIVGAPPELQEENDRHKQAMEYAATEEP